MHAVDFLDAPEKCKTGPAVVVYGKERFLKLEAIRQVSALVLGSSGDELSLSRLPGPEIDLKTVVDALLTVSMWNPKQVVLVEDADDFVSNFRAGLEEYLERPAKKSVLVLDVKSWPANTRLAKKVAAVGLPIDCGELKGAPLLNWIVKSCRTRQGKKIDRNAAQLIIDLAGADLGLIDQELAKLAAYVGTSPAIDSSAVEKLVGGWKMETTWKMLDAVRDGQLGTALEYLDKLLIAGEPPVKLLGGIAWLFRSVAKATELSRQGQPLPEALAEAGVKPYNVQPMIPYLRRIGRPRAERILQYLLSTDLDLKSSSGYSDRMILERLLLQLVGKV
jgi:DNA polymerase-3 subunit delta